jgi:NAD(P)-dependent dehydrogenase (short-subunit alcohol dehydrogenase family)
MRVVIVTGAASGMGRACALNEAAAGATVIACDLDEAGARDTVDAIVEGDQSAVAVGADLSDVQSIRRLVADEAAKHGRLEGLIHCAAISLSRAFAELDESEYERLLAANLKSSVFLVQAAGGAMREHGGAIVLFGSIAARSPRPFAVHYGISKAGVVSLTWSSAAALGPTVRVNAVCPGWIDTPMSRKIADDRHRLFGTPLDNPYPELVEASALKRAGTTEEIAAVAHFLLGPGASFITGQAINVDGGVEHT